MSRRAHVLRDNGAGEYWACHVRELERGRRWRAKNPNRRAEWFKENHERELDLARERNRERRAREPWIFRHHLSVVGFVELLAMQDERCAGCGVSVEEYVKTTGRLFDVDHDHAHCDRCGSGKGSCGESIRGLLCRACNRLDVLKGRPPAFQSETSPRDCRCGESAVAVVLLLDAEGQVTGDPIRVCGADHALDALRGESVWTTA